MIPDTNDASLNIVKEIENSKLAQVSTPTKEFYFQHSVLIENLISRKSKATKFIYTMVLAELYLDISFNVPIYVDFRGRSYRNGYLHLQSDHLVRHLLLWKDFSFAKNSEPTVNQDLFLEKYALSLGMSKKKWSSIAEAQAWGLSYLNKEVTVDLQHLNENDWNDPFQFLALSPHLCRYTGRRVRLGKYSIPETIMSLSVRRDATSSVYQILSLLGDSPEIAQKCNVLSVDNKISDMYSILIHEFHEFMRTNRNSAKVSDSDHKIILQLLQENKLNREVIKMVSLPWGYNISFFCVLKIF